MDFNGDQKIIILEMLLKEGEKGIHDGNFTGTELEASAKMERLICGKKDKLSEPVQVNQL